MSPKPQAPLYAESLVVPARRKCFPRRWCPDAVDPHGCSGVSTRELKYIPDGAVDEWLYPARTERKGGGDCEDLAIHWLATQARAAFTRGDTAALVIGRIADGQEHAIGEHWLAASKQPRYFDCRAPYNLMTPRDFEPLYWLGVWPNQAQWLCLPMRKREPESEATG